MNDIANPSTPASSGGSNHPLIQAAVLHVANEAIAVAAKQARSEASDVVVGRYLDPEIGAKTTIVSIPGIGPVCHFTVATTKGKAVVSDPAAFTEQVRREYPTEAVYEVTVRVAGGYGANRLVEQINEFFDGLSETYGASSVAVTPAPPERWKPRDPFKKALLAAVTEPPVDEVTGERLTVADKNGVELEGVVWQDPPPPGGFTIPAASWKPGAKEKILRQIDTDGLGAFLEGSVPATEVTAGAVVLGELVESADPPGTT